MKAAYLETTGKPEVIRFGEVPTPEPKAGEVLVRLGAAALNPIDLYIRAGMVAMPLPIPYIPGCYLAGLVWYATLYDASPEKVTYAPPGLAPDFAAHLREAAARTVQADRGN